MLPAKANAITPAIETVQKNARNRRRSAMRSISPVRRALALEEIALVKHIAFYRPVERFVRARAPSFPIIDIQAIAARCAVVIVGDGGDNGRCIGAAYYDEGRTRFRRTTSTLNERPNAFERTWRVYSLT